MSMQPLTPPPAVPPPPGGLGSNQNYVLSNCSHIVGLIATIDVTQDIVLRSSANSKDQIGFGFQLNCYSPPDYTDAWQQYALVAAENVFPRPGEGWGQLNAIINNYTATGSPVIFEYDTLMVWEGNTMIPAGYQLQIRLINDAQDNIVGVHCIVNDLGFPPAPTTPLTGYVLPDTSAVTTTNNSGTNNNSNNDTNRTEQHINYIGIDGHIHERFHRAEGNWIHDDLSVLAGSSILPAANSALDAYADLDGGQHVNFIGTDGHVHELYIAQGGHWIDNDLNQLSKGPPILPMPGSPLDGYVDSDKGQHVNFIGTDGHIHELFIASGGHWINNDLIILSGNGIAPRPNSPLDGYVDNDNGQHVNFIGTDGHVHKLYIRPKGQWINNDLIMLSGNGITPSRTSPLSGYMAQDNGQHVNFIGTDGHVHELYNLHSAQWLNNDLTQLAQLSGPSVPPAPDSKLCGYWAWSDGKQHVNFTGTDGHVHDLSIAPNGQWTNSDLTQLSGPSSATPASDGALHSYPQPNGDLHVNFIGVNDAHLHELLLGPLAQWVDNDLNNIPLANFLKSPLGLSPNQIAPINAFELDLVGPGDGTNAVFSSGAGTFIYAAATPMTVQSCLPPCAGTTEGAAETSNSVYGDLDAGPSIVITQTFSIDPTERVIRRQGPVFKLPLKPGETLKPIPVPQQA
jgi:hypothetical protein